MLSAKASLYRKQHRCRHVMHTPFSHPLKIFFQWLFDVLEMIFFMSTLRGEAPQVQVLACSPHNVMFGSQEANMKEVRHTL
jgi:hypothetical protein